MTSAQIEELATALDLSSLLQGQAAAAAIRAQWDVEVTPSNGPRAELIRTYGLRLVHLQSKTSAHARQLAASTQEFFENLRVHAEETVGTWFTAGGDAEHEFLVFCSADGQPLGCMRTVSQSHVTPQRWRELWDGEA